MTEAIIEKCERCHETLYETDEACRSPNKATTKFVDVENCGFCNPETIDMEERDETL